MILYFKCAELKPLASLLSLINTKQQRGAIERPVRVDRRRMNTVIYLWSLHIKRESTSQPRKMQVGQKYLVGLLKNIYLLFLSVDFLSCPCSPHGTVISAVDCGRHSKAFTFDGRFFRGPPVLTLLLSSYKAQNNG